MGKDTWEIQMSIELFDWQKPSRDRLVQIFQSGSLIAGNFSDCGSGKTFCTIDMLNKLDTRALVISPKAVISSWWSVARMFGAEGRLLDVINLEKLQTGKTPWFRDNKWFIPEGAMAVLDEAHRGCSSPKSLTTKMVALLKAYKVPVLALTATPADSPLKLRALGYLFDLHRFNNASYYDWAARNGCFRNPWNGFSFTKGPKGQEIMARIGNQIKDRVVRIRIDDIPEFPEASLQAELVDLSDEERAAVNAAYSEMLEELSKPNTNIMTEILRSRQIAEINKVNVMKDLVVDCLEAEHSCVIFTSFRATMQALRELLEDLGHRVALVHGVQGVKEQEERDKAIEDFQNNKKHVMLAMGSAGGVGVSFHDLYGRPRRSYINLSYNAVECRQMLGRIHRAGSKSKAVQTILLASGTLEEKIYDSVVGKLKNIDSLNDSDLDTTKQYWMGT